jgi:hypothetical protein
MLALTLLFLVSACASRTYVAGFPIGDRVCAGPPSMEEWLCQGMTTFAQAMLDETVPDHAPVTAVEAYGPDYRTADGGRILHARGTAGGEAVVVIRTADDAVRAFYVFCIAGPWGDESSPPPNALHCGPMEPMDGES